MYFSFTKSIFVQECIPSRMRTGRALTVSGGGGVVHPRRNFWEKKLKKKEKNFGDPRKIGEPPRKMETPRKIGDPPRKIGDPPEKLETPKKIGDPPEKLETSHPQNWRPPGTRSPLWTDTRL